MPMHKGVNMLSQEEVQAIPVLIRLIMGLNAWDLNEMRIYLEENYKIIFEGKTDKDKNGNLGKTAKAGIKENPFGSGLIRTKYVEEWKKFYTSEEGVYIANIKNAIYKNGKSFSKPNSFNWESVYSLIDNIGSSSSIYYFNTYIDLEEWFDPIIQMHLCIQKSIEQKINFYHIQECHKNKTTKDRQIHITNCTKTPPVYRQFRVMFLAMTRKELLEIIESKNNVYNTLCYIAYMHTSLSIQLALFTLDDWCELIENNKDFFKEERNLEFLRIDKEIKEIVETKFNLPDIKRIIKKSVKDQSEIPSTEEYNGIDYLFATSVNHRSKNDIEEEKHQIWASFYHINKKEDKTQYFKDKITTEEEKSESITKEEKNESITEEVIEDKSEGLNYYQIPQGNEFDVKAKFTELIMELISEEDIAKRAKHKKLDPIYDFYTINGERFKSFTRLHDASLILNLDRR